VGVCFFCSTYSQNCPEASVCNLGQRDAVDVRSGKDHRQPESPSLTPFIRLVERNCAFDLPTRIENMNFTGAKFSRGASFTKALRPLVSLCERRHKTGALSNRAS
jgi:hypothetical protein